MAVLTGISRTDQHRALGLSTLAFTLCFAVWTIFSILGISIKQDLHLSDTQLGLLMATPILSGSVSRIFLGLITDRKSTRLNSSHVRISYAVFCMKKIK